MSFTTCLSVVAGGALGTFARYVLSVLAVPISHRIPWGTIFVNLSGCAIIGFVVELVHLYAPIWPSCA